jgi:hypothetical protein
MKAVGVDVLPSRHVEPSYRLNCACIKRRNAFIPPYLAVLTGVCFVSVEHYLQWSKYSTSNEQLAADILACPCPLQVLSSPAPAPNTSSPAPAPCISSPAPAPCPLYSPAPAPCPLYILAFAYPLPPIYPRPPLISWPAPAPCRCKGWGSMGWIREGTGRRSRRSCWSAPSPPSSLSICQQGMRCWRRARRLCG